MFQTRLNLINRDSLVLFGLIPPVKRKIFDRLTSSLCSDIGKMVKEEERRESFRPVYSGNWKVSICYRVLLFFFLRGNLREAVKYSNCS